METVFIRAIVINSTFRGMMGRKLGERCGIRLWFLIKASWVSVYSLSRDRTEV